MIEIKEYANARSYLTHILNSNIVEEINTLIKNTENYWSQLEADEKIRKQNISDTLKLQLSVYGRRNFYRQIGIIVDYNEQFDVNNHPDAIADQDLIKNTIEKMEGTLVSASYMGLIHGYTRQNIHVLIKKYDYQNFLVGQTVAFKLMDII